MDIETPRLLLRNWQPEDLEPFARMNQDSMVMRCFPATLPIEESREKAERAAIVLGGMCFTGPGRRTPRKSTQNLCPLAPQCVEIRTGPHGMI